MNKLIANQKFVSAHKIQADFAKIVKTAEKEGVFYQILRHSEPKGVYLPQQLWTWFLSGYKDQEGDYRKAFVEKVFGSLKDKPTRPFKGRKEFLTALK
ncbi:MAG: hypothetical protein HY398_00405 [Candidatus Doudnabacteria bacterium]|nr:hypothetical protein [Candidatus Doudnabacteria bacterium]